LGLAILGGIIGGFITSREYFQAPKVLFADKENFFEEEVEEEYHHLKHKNGEQEL